MSTELRCWHKHYSLLQILAIPLACILAGCSSAAEKGAATSASRNSIDEQSVRKRSVSAEVTQWLEERKKNLGIVATTRTRSGQIIDWIPRGNQATPPPPLTPLAVDAVRAPVSELELDPNAKGPEGTVPVLRPDPERIHAPGSVDDFLSKFGRAGMGDGAILASQVTTANGSPQPGVNKSLIDGGADYKYVGSFKNVVNFGIDARINIWNPFVEEGLFMYDHSLAQVNVMRGSGIQLQTIEAGWQDDPNRYGDTNVHFFIFYTLNGYSQDGNNLGGYNREVTGWQQWSSTLFPGAVLSPTSSAGISNQVEVWVQWRFIGGNWWLWFINQWVGYYPGSLFNGTGLQTQGAQVGVQGEVADTNIFSATTTDMGSGNFASAGRGLAAYIRLIQYVSSTTPTFVRYTPTQVTVSNANCYSHVGGYASNDPNLLSHFFFGGPGKNTNCP